MGLVAGPQPLPGGGDIERQPLDLLQMQGGQRLQALSALRGQMQPDRSVVLCVALARDQSGGVGAVDQPDRRVVAEQEVVGGLADRRPARVRVAADRQQQLMLRRGQSGICSAT
jgi:hypothetical protein